MNLACSTLEYDCTKQVSDLVNHYLLAWGKSRQRLPDFTVLYTPAQQAEKERQVNNLLKQFNSRYKIMPWDLKERESLRQELIRQALTSLPPLMGWDEAAGRMIRTAGFVESFQDFIQAAHRFDSSIANEDIYQAGRNVMTMNCMQLLLGLPVRMTPSVFAYSMLYPYSDNLLDDPTISREEKISFSGRFRQRLAGERLSAKQPYEQKVFALVEMIESEHDRTQRPKVYDNLLAIQDAQTRSLGQWQNAAGEDEIPAISFEKGGTSVMTGGYLVGGDLCEEAAAFMFGFGCMTQLMDDLEDAPTDQANGSQTVFSILYGHRSLDTTLNRLFDFSAYVLEQIKTFSCPNAGVLYTLMTQSIHPVIILAAAQHAAGFSGLYLHGLEPVLPVRYSFMKALSERQQTTLPDFNRVIELFRW